MGGSPSKQEKATRAVPKSKDLPEAQGQIAEQNQRAAAPPPDIRVADVRGPLQQSSSPLAPVTADLSQPIVIPQPKAQQEKSLATKLRELYKSQDTLPKLIDADEIPQHSLEQYYIKLQIVLNQGSADEKQAAAHDKVVGEKQSVEIEKIFSAVGESKEAKKLLIVGAAGVGKTTLLHYMSYRWGKGDLWGDKFDYVFRVKLKELLSQNWKSDYDLKTELRQDKLGCFLHYCLGQDSSKLEIQPSDIMAIANKNKVLLLLDGYDEVADLAGKRDYQDIMRAIDNYQNVVMSSRPNALNDPMKKKFDRQVENQGLGVEGTKKYIDVHFGARGEESLKQQLTSFLITNSQVAEMCQIPINLALVSLVWRDPKTREELTSNEGFNLGKLYEEVVVWLGKRYLEKFAGKSHQEAQNLSNEQIFLQPEMEFLTKVAYDSFVRTGKLVEKEVIKENLHSHKIELAKVNKWGLLKPEGDTRKQKDEGTEKPEEEGTKKSKDKDLKLIDMNYQFIHLTFQEYLTAYYLKNQLTSDQAKIQAAIFIGSHRNEPKYLMTLKFLAGLVTASEDQPLVTRFWESVSCNVDGVLELGIEGKISLLMHLLAQSKNKGEFDPRIPNLEQMQKLVDGVIGADFTKWTAQIIASSYLPPAVVEKIHSVLGTPLDKVEIKELTAAIKVITALANRAEFGGKTAIFEQLVKLIKGSKDWQLQKFALEKLALVADASVAAEQLESGFKLVMSLITDNNVKQAANSALVAIAKIAPTTQTARLLQQVLNDPEANWDFKEAAARSLPEVVKAMPELAGQAFDLLQQVLNDPEANWDFKRAAAKSLTEVVKAMPNKAEAFGLLQQVLNDPKTGYELKKAAVSILPEVVKAKPELAGQAFGLLQQALNDPKTGYELKKAAVSILPEVVKAMPELVGYAFKLLQQVLVDPKAGLDFKKVAAWSLPEIVKAKPELAGQASTLLQQVLNDPKADWSLKYQAASSLTEIVKAMPELAGQASTSLQQVLNDPKADWRLKYQAASSLPEIVKAMPELAGQAFRLLQRALNDPESDLSFKKAAAESLTEVVKAKPELAGQAFELLQQALNDPKADWSFEQAAARSLAEVVKAKPELAGQAFSLLQQAFSLLQQAFNDPKASGGFKYEAARSLAEVVKAKPELAGQAFDLFQQVLNDPKANWSFKYAAASGLTEIVKAMPNKAQSFELLKYALNDPKADGDLKKAAAWSLPEIVCIIPIQESLTLLHNDSPEVRSAAKKGMLEKLKEPVDYKEISGLARLIEQTAKSAEQDDKQLNADALRALENIGSNIDHVGVRWVNEHFGELPDIEATRIFFKNAFPKILKDSKITEIKSQFLIKAILKYGFTVVINPAAGQIIFEDVSYRLESDSTKMLEHIVTQIIENSSDELVAQYKTHQPLFKNTGSALPVAAVDVADGSIVDGIELAVDSWHVSLMHLSDHKQSEPSSVFILLEKRGSDGRHLVQKISLKQNKLIKEPTLQCKEYNKLPQEIDAEFLQEIFGEMEYHAVKPRYYGTIYKDVSQEQVMSLMKQVTTSENVADSQYQIMHQLFCHYAAREMVDGLSGNWADYVKDGGIAKLFTKMQLLKCTGEAANLARRDSLGIETYDKHEQKLKLHGKVILDLKSRLSLLEETSLLMVKQVEADRNLNQSEKAEIKGAIISLKASVAEVSGKMADYDPVFGHIIEDMQGLMARKELDTRAIMILRKKVKEFEQKLSAEATKVSMLNEIVYDNKLLNYPELFNAILKIFGSRGLDLSCNLDPELLQQAINQQDPELLLAGMVSLDKAYIS